MGPCGTPSVWGRGSPTDCCSLFLQNDYEIVLNPGTPISDLALIYAVSMTHRET